MPNQIFNIQIGATALGGGAAPGHRPNKKNPSRVTKNLRRKGRGKGGKKTDKPGKDKNTTKHEPTKTTTPLHDVTNTHGTAEDHGHEGANGRGSRDKDNDIAMDGNGLVLRVEGTKNKQP